MPETANGPEDVPVWDAVNWAVHERNVARLRQRIFTAVRDGDWPKARNLQKLMLRSWSNTLVSVRQVTQRNAGRRTAGIDRVVALDGPSRMDMAREVMRTVKSWEPLPVRETASPRDTDGHVTRDPVTMGDLLNRRVTTAAMLLAVVLIIAMNAILIGQMLAAAM